MFFFYKLITRVSFLCMYYFDSLDKVQFFFRQCRILRCESTYDRMDRYLCHVQFMFSSFFLNFILQHDFEHVSMVFNNQISIELLRWVKSSFFFNVSTASGTFQINSLPVIGGELSTKIPADVSFTQTLAPLHTITLTKYSPPSCRSSLVYV